MARHAFFFFLSERGDGWLFYIVPPPSSSVFFPLPSHLCSRAAWLKQAAPACRDQTCNK